MIQTYELEHHICVSLNVHKQIAKGIETEIKKANEVSKKSTNNIM